MKQFFIFLIILQGLMLNAQIDKRLNFTITKPYRGVKEKITFHYHNITKTDWVTRETLDSLRRPVITESYFKSELRSRSKYFYNDNGDITLIVNDSDINNPNKVDSIKMVYKYRNRMVLEQYFYHPRISSYVLKLIQNEGDSLLIYRKTYLDDKTSSYNKETKYIYKYNDQGLLVYKELVNELTSESRIWEYSYYDNDQIKRRIIRYKPERELSKDYTPGPGSDDEFYEYTYDVLGRVKEYFLAIDGLKHKRAEYKYK